MNQMVGERLSIITSKAQTTRHRILGIISGDNFQLIYSDTPGIIRPEYKLQESMMHFVKSSLEDADVILLVTDLYDTYDEKLAENIKHIKAPIILVMNKIDQAKGTQATDKMNYWKEAVTAQEYHAISALEGTNIETLFSSIINLLPEHPAYFPKDQLTDRPERFFAAEIIREKIFLNYKKEVPYSTEVEIEEFFEEETIIRIRALIYVERKSQKGIIIGKNGEALKKTGTMAREELEQFFEKKVFLQTFVKVADDWRKKQRMLKSFGYQNS